MSENYLMLNGKRIDLTDEQVKTLMAEEKESPFARVGMEEEYFYVGVDGEVQSTNDEKDTVDNSMFSVANYCTGKSMMEQRAFHETLNRLLWRYSEEHGGDNEWDGQKLHWSIASKNNELEMKCAHFCKFCGVVYFKDVETAQSAIEEIVKPFMGQHPEFVW